MDTIERIKTLLAADGISVTAFARKIGFPQASVQFYLKQERKAPMEFIVAILEKYPEVNAEWLLRGEGEMYKKPAEDIPSIPQALLESELQKMKDSLKAEILSEVKNA